MIAAALVLALALPQDTVLDVPVYENRAFGVALPRPFDDWVFDASTARGTTTIIFLPRTGSLGDGLWGALVLTTFDRTQSLARLAERRVATSWRPQFGASFTLLGRDSLDVLGLPAIRLRMSGTTDRVALEIEEYLVARDGDLLLLQLRYPRGLRRDSVATGYRRTLDGLAIRDAPGRAGAATDGADQTPARWRALAASPWHVERGDVLVRTETAGGARTVVARLEVVNDGIVATDTVVVWLPALARLDNVMVGARRAAVTGRGRSRTVHVGDAVEPGARATITTSFTWTGAAGPWLPLVQSPTDSAGAPLRTGAPAMTLRFDLPDSLRAVAPGHLVAEAVAAGRRRLTWSSDEAAELPVAIGAWTPAEVRRGRLTVVLWRRPSGPLADTAAAHRIATSAANAWSRWHRAFGPVPLAAVHLVEAGAATTRGAFGVVFLGADAHTPGVLARELARTWWGGQIRLEGPGADFVLDALPAWAAARLGETPVGPAAPGVAALDAVAAAIGDPRLREALRTFAADGRGGWLTVEDLLHLLGPSGAETLRGRLR